MIETVVANYRVKAGSESPFEELLSKHWPTLHRLGLVADQPTTIYKGEEQDGSPLYIEIFTWLEGGAQRAHELPEVMSVWEPMGALCESRGGRPSMEFPHVQLLDLELVS